MKGAKTHHDKNKHGNMDLPETAQILKIKL
jgi:hypothetical protein